MGKIYFIHIMKTGGTSFRQMLTEEYGHLQIYPNGDDLDEFENRWYPKAQWVADNIKNIRAHKVLVGHYPYSLINELDGYKSTTVIREPFGRTLSMLGHRLKKTKDATMTIEKLLDNEDVVSRQILNYQTKVMGMPLGEVNLKSEINNDVFIKACENLEKMDFIGINEYYEKSCQLFDYQYGTNLINKIRHDNKAKIIPDVSSSLKRKINQLIEMDTELYNLALEHFLIKCKNFK